MKFTLTEGINNSTVITCLLNQQDQSPEVALKSLGLLSLHQPLTVVLFADERLNTPQFVKVLNKQFPSVVITIGFNAIAEFASAASHQHFASERDFYETIQKDSFSRDTILVIQPEQQQLIDSFFDSKIRQTVLDVNLEALAGNIRYYQSKLNPGVQLMTLVKAFSYGSGSYEVGCLMQYLGVSYLGVAASDEGINMRRSGITMPIIVLTPEIDNCEEMVKYKLEPEIHNLRSLSVFSRAVSRLGMTNYPIHIKIDSGMHRQGFELKDIDELVDTLKNNTYVRVSSVFTHLAATDDEKHDDFTHQQLDVYTKASEALQNKLGYKITRHALNSVGIERFPEGQFDMARLGIGMYGGSSTSYPHAQVVSTLRSVVTQIKDVQPSETVGYGRRGEIKNPTRIAVVPIGYADGLNRRLSCGVGRFMINGQSAPIIGTICMDLTMVDITGLNVQEEDKVVIFGEDPTAFELAEKLGTITYEIFTSVAARVKRIYRFTEKLFDK